MAINIHNAKWLLLALLSLATVSGCCCQAIPLPGENQCPTDARRLYCTCGEEAVRRCPCGPDREFYGLKPTCWREWPEGWQCNGCEGSPYVDRAMCGEPVTEVAVVETPVIEAPAKENVDLSNPFRSKPGTAELPVPPQTPEFAPKQTTPVETPPVQLIPAQPAPTPPRALEKVPTGSAPPAKTSATEKATDEATGAVVPTPKAPVAAPLIAPIVQVEATVPNPMPIVPAAVKMTASAPILVAPQNAPAAATAPKPEPKPVQVAAAPKAEQKLVKKKAEIPKVKDLTEDRALSSRVEQHLLNNLRL